MKTETEEWPACEACGGVNCKVHREPQISGFEDQFFTCASCPHITVRTVIMSDDDLAALAKAA